MLAQATFIEVTNKIKELEAQYKKAVNDAAAEVTAEILKSGIPFIVILGWTPGFNDGEPCEHSTDYMYSFDQLEDHGIELDFLSDDVQEELNDVPAWRAPQEVKDAYDSDFNKISGYDFRIRNKDVESAIDNVLIPAFDNAYGTNYKITIWRDSDGVVHLEQDDYECGY